MKLISIMKLSDTCKSVMIDLSLYCTTLPLHFFHFCSTKCSQSVIVQPKIKISCYVCIKYIRRIQQLNPTHSHLRLDDQHAVKKTYL